MKRLFQISLLLIFVSAFALIAEDKNGSELQRKSQLHEPTFLSSVDGVATSYPYPFDEFTWMSNQGVATPSVGYYFYDNHEALIMKDGERDDIWHPTGFLFDADGDSIKEWHYMYDDAAWHTRMDNILDTTYQSKYWNRIIQGPRMYNPTFWNNVSIYGKYYFRNPADAATGNMYDSGRTDIDSTVNAIAGPMPLGIRDGFYFNGIRYDSFYVSTTGLIALTNRRYIYDQNGNKTIPTGSDNCYDIQSMDWLVGQNRVRTNDGLGETLLDDFGYTCSVLGAEPIDYAGATSPVYDPNAGIRYDASGSVDVLDAINDAYDDYTASRPALIAPFWGQLQFSQYNKEREQSEDYSKVYFRYSPTGDSTIIAYYNIGMRGTLQRPFAPDYTLDDLDNRLDDNDNGIAATDGYFEWDAKVIFARQDSSITFVYENFRGTGKVADGESILEDDMIATAGDMMRANTYAGVFGWTRSRYDETPANLGEVNYPWSDEYELTTIYWSRFKSDEVNLAPYEGTAVKFKQWRNTTRVVDLSYMVRNEGGGINDEEAKKFTWPVDEVDNYELLAGELPLGAVQPVAVVQNLSNDVQGPSGVNYITQDYEFYAQFRYANTTTGRTVYSANMLVGDQCMRTNDHTECYPEAGARIRLVEGFIANDFLMASVDTMAAVDGVDEFGAPYNGYADAGFDGVPPYYYARVEFPPHETNEFIDAHIGKMRGICVTNSVRKGEDQWPFDDTLFTDLFVMRRLDYFAETVSDYHIDCFTGTPIPSPLKWVSINADVVSGDDISQHAMPPRGLFKAEAVENSVPVYISSPTIRLNRTRTLKDGTQTDEGVVGKEVYNGDVGETATYYGDEIRSFPIDLRQSHGAVLSLTVQRGANYYDGWVTGKSRFWGDEMLHGPEPRVIHNNDITSSLAPGADGNEYPDMLVVEFARPSYNYTTQVCNITDVSWRIHPQKSGSEGLQDTTITSMPALTIFGGGGKMVGFLESDKDSALAPPASVFSLNGLRPDVYDDGVDFEFKQYFVAVPDTFIDWMNDGARNFRFRIRTLARNSQIDPRVPTEADDCDDFFVDNVYLTIPDEVTDIAVNSVFVNWPYAKAPATQLEAIPVMVQLSNNTSLTSADFSVRLKIYKSEHFDKDKAEAMPGEKPIYCRYTSITNFGGSTTIDLNMPTWNVRKHGEGKYILVGEVIFPHGDANNENDITYSEQFIGFGETIQYESTEKEDADMVNNNRGINDVEEEQRSQTVDPNNPGVLIPGKGLGLPGYTVGVGVGQEQQVGAGEITDNTSGKMAVKFEINEIDTLRGYNIYLGGLSKAPDMIELNVFKNKFNEATIVDEPSAQALPGAFIQKSRGGWINNDYYFDQYYVYELDAPIELIPGKYWITITQTAPDALQLGASADRAGMRVMNYDEFEDGEDGQTLYLDRAFRKNTLLPDGSTQRINTNLFCYSNGNAIDKWLPFTPHIGNLSFPHTDHNGLTRNIGEFANPQTLTFTNAAWVPMFQPYFGPRTSGYGADEYVECDIIPIELIAFDGFARKDGIELVWQTASETNNAGFEIERRIIGSNTWNIVGVADGQGTSVTRQYYNYFDADVISGETYYYRLTQIDDDGSQSCLSSNVIKVKFDVVGEVTLSQNAPNPFNYRTTIQFELIEDADYKVEVIDMYGRVIKVLDKGHRSAGHYSTEWYGVDANGTSVANGTYIYRLTAGDRIITNKMTFLK